MTAPLHVHGAEADVVDTIGLLALRWYDRPVVAVGDPGVADVVVRIDSTWEPPIADAEGLDPLRRGARWLDAFEVAGDPTSECTVTARGGDGAFRGLVALLRGDPPGVRGPRSAWRGLSLDVARHFYAVSELEAIVDLMTFYGLNVLHLHLTDSQAWRVPIGAWPALTPDGASWYSRRELDALVGYAAQRRVIVIPEIDMPGHTLAALRAYPVLVGPEPPRHPWLGHLRPGVAEAMRFVDDVLDTLVQLGPSPYVHVGGDEAFGMDPGEYAEFMAIVAEGVRRRGGVPIGWQEAARSGAFGPGDVLQLWTSPRDLPTAADIERMVPERFAELRQVLAASFAEAPGDVRRAVEAGAAVLLSPSWPFYLDRPYADAASPPLGNPGYPPSPIPDVWEWTPGETLGDHEAAAVVAGVEAAIWAETITSFDDLATLLLPRLALLGEMMWTGDRRPFAAARDDIEAHTDVWNRLGFAAYHRSPDVFGPIGAGS